MRASSTACLYAYLAGRSAARRDAALENARLRPESAREWVMIAKSFHRSFIADLRRARQFT